MRTRTISFSLITLLLFLILAISCSDTGTDPDTPEDITITLTPVDSESENVLNDATHRDATTDDVIAVGEDDITREKDTELTIRTDNDGHESTITTLDFDADKEVEIRLTAEEPDSVTITYYVNNDAGESLTDAEVSIADTLVASGADGTFELPRSDSETVTVCGSAEWHEDDCTDLTPNTDQGIELYLSREMVSVSVTPEIIGYTDLLAVAESSWPIVVNDHTFYYLSVGDSTRSGAGRAVDSDTKIAEGVKTTIQYPAGPDPIPVSIRAEYFPAEGHAYSDEHYLNVAEGKTEVSGDTESDIQLNLEHVPACRDEIDNDFDGTADKDDTGCVVSDGNYDPDDDVEVLKGWQRSFGSTATDKTYSISGAEGERDILIVPSYVQSFPQSISTAISIIVDVEILVSEDQTGEEFALEWYTGQDDSNLNTVNRTEISEDQGRDGWVFARFQDIDKSFFANGTSFEVVAVHATKIRSEPTTNGNDDVIFLQKGDDTTRAFVITWLYEPEEVNSQQKLQTRQYEMNSPQGTYTVRGRPVEEQQVDLK